MLGIHQLACLCCGCVACAVAPHGVNADIAAAHGEVVVDALQGESARRAITGAEFFNRFPSLHTFLLTQLQAATKQLQQGGGVVHPSLFPVLALLSRLR